jgi:alkylation response protein AidB-like acyl-CoA dehydrogenase
MDGAEPQGDALDWKQRVVARGWGAPTWPVEYGGGGLSPGAAKILQQEMSRIAAYNPVALGLGLSMIGPTLLDYGTPEQKQRHAPPIARGELRWCVGYSEPGAGSDLASLTTRAEDKGDHYQINGQKVWTSGAHYADWCGALVRTDPNVKKHDGISFMLINMRQPGVEARPIKLIAGASSFCETFFDDAWASKDDLLGELNKGWSVGKRLLQHERSSQTAPNLSLAAKIGPLQDLAKRYLGTDSQGRVADHDLRMRLTDHLMNSKVHALTVARAEAEAKGGGGPTNAVSVLKSAATVVSQTRFELAVEIMGMNGLGWEGEGFSPEELQTTRDFLDGKARSITGGTFEIQRNIIAKRILGLPDATPSA